MNRARSRSRLRGLSALLAWCAALALPAQGVAAVVANACTMETTSTPAAFAGSLAHAHAGHATDGTSRVERPDRSPGPAQDCGTPCSDGGQGNSDVPAHSGHGCQMMHCAGALAVVVPPASPTVPESAARETARAPVPLRGDLLAEPSPPPRA